MFILFLCAMKTVGALYAALRGSPQVTYVCVSFAQRKSSDGYVLAPEAGPLLHVA